MSRFGQDQAQHASSSSSRLPTAGHSRVPSRGSRYSMGPPPYTDIDIVSPVSTLEGASPPDNSPSNFHSVTEAGPGGRARTAVKADGTLDIWVDLKGDVKERFLHDDLPEDHAPEVVEYAVDRRGGECPPLNIVIFLVGSRAELQGDIQPYIALALNLIIAKSHTVRIATHGTFQSFVVNANKQLAGKVGKNGEQLKGKLLFYDVGGDPKELMAYMVKNPGLLPGWESLRNGDIKAKQKMTANLLRGFYSSTHQPDPISGQPFAADAIISNPPAFAHIHIAEALGLPLLMSFTMPWSPTMVYGHPLVNVRLSDAQPGVTNYIGYGMSEKLMWQGLGSVINKFRKRVLRLDPLNDSQGPSVLDRLKIPWTYCWSQSLLPKPKDWKNHIDISGFYFYQDGKEYIPPVELIVFIKAGPPPIYIGFGSVPLTDPEKVTETIFEVARRLGVRFLISAGWAGLGKDGVPEDLEGSVFILRSDCPHDWLFADGRVSAVCHHGGAGTTAIGLLNGLPTIIVPFFGDQKFWGESIQRAGAGPAPILPKKLDVDTLSKGIEFALQKEVKDVAEQIGLSMRAERGEMKGVESFHRHMPLLNMRCDVDPSRAAIWWHKGYMMKLSGAVAVHLDKIGKLDITKLVPHRTREYDPQLSNADPLSGGAEAVIELITYTGKSIGQLFTSPKKGVVNTFYGIPKAAWGFFDHFYETFDNVPRLAGSHVRRRPRVDGVFSGILEGTAGLLLSGYDALAGLVVEPVKGFKEEGTLGAFKGFGRGLTGGLTMPLAGMMGFFVQPTRGAARSYRRHVNSSEHVLCAPRIAISKHDAKTLTDEQKNAIWYKFAELTTKENIHKRKKWFARRLRRWTKGDQGAFRDGFDAIGNNDDDETDEDGTASGFDTSRRTSVDGGISRQTSIDNGSRGHERDGKAEDGKKREGKELAGDNGRAPDDADHNQAPPDSEESPSWGLREIPHPFGTGKDLPPLPDDDELSDEDDDDDSDDFGFSQSATLVNPASIHSSHDERPVLPPLTSAREYGPNITMTPREHLDDVNERPATHMTDHSASDTQTPTFILSRPLTDELSWRRGGSGHSGASTTASTSTSAATSPILSHATLPSVADHTGETSPIARQTGNDTDRGQLPSNTAERSGNGSGRRPYLFDYQRRKADRLARRESTREPMKQEKSNNDTGGTSQNRE